MAWAHASWTGSTRTGHGLSLSFFLSLSLSLSPDHFGSSLGDLHVDHTAGVDVGGKVDLRKLRLR